MASFPEQFGTLPISAEGRWTTKQLTAVVRLGWGNLSALGESAKNRLDPESQKIRRDYLYFELQLGEDPTSVGIDELDLSPLIHGFERSRKAASSRYDQFRSHLGEHDPLSIANFEEAARLETFRSVLDRYTRPFPYVGGSMSTDELNRLIKIERDITNQMGPQFTDTAQTEFNQTEAQRRLGEMRLMKPNFGQDLSNESIGSSRWVTALNFGGPIVALGIASLAIPEVRDIVFSAGQGALNAATELMQNRGLMP